MEGQAEQPWEGAREDTGGPETEERRPTGTRPEDILTPKQYVSYQHGRILSGLLVVFACMFVLGSATQAVADGCAKAALEWLGGETPVAVSH